MVNKRRWLRWRGTVLFFSIALGVLVVDQVSKYGVLVTNPSLIYPYLTIHLVKNTGAAFGLLRDKVLLLGFISLLTAFIIIFSHKKLIEDRVPLFLFSLFLGGVLGNLVDRLVRGYVVDFIDFGFWPAFNVADAMITISVMGLILYYWKKK